MKLLSLVLLLGVSSTSLGQARQCVRWVTEPETCGFQRACKYACIAAGGAISTLVPAGRYIFGAVVTVGSEICANVCEDVKNCIPGRTYCAETVLIGVYPVEGDSMPASSEVETARE